MILLKNYLTNSSVCCVIFYYSRFFITIKNLELSYKVKKDGHPKTLILLFLLNFHFLNAKRYLQLDWLALPAFLAIHL